MRSGMVEMCISIFCYEVLMPVSVGCVDGCGLEFGTGDAMGVTLKFLPKAEREGAMELRTIGCQDGIYTPTFQ